ncbi:hypothetical protein C5E11_02905 [Clavibacter michiganensis]|nr:hypothetical protein [Clavibacter michiganensis]PPF65024.1 hypothetical protein C5E11_02905 [Clavibacter michiganensis]
MDVLLWTGWACSLVVVFFMVLIGVFGSVAMKSPSWDAEFWSLAHRELRRRGLTTRQLSISETQSWQRFAGQTQVAPEPDMRFRDGVLDTVAVLVGAGDHAKVRAYLDGRSDILMRAALTDVSSSVQKIANLNIASRVWVVRRWVALFVVLGQGLVWFLPRCLRRVAKVIERYMAAATILGIVGGLLYWGFVDDAKEPSEGGVGWVNFVGIVVTVGTVVALVLAVGQQFLLVAVAVAGPVRAWTRKGIMTAAIFLVFAIGMLVLLKSGAWTRWQLDANRFLIDLLDDTPAGDWLGKILLTAIIAFAVYRALGWARARWVKVGDRVSAIAGATVFTLFGVVLLLFVLGAPNEVVVPVMYVFLSSFVIFGLLDVVFSIAEWTRKYRVLRASGIEVRRGWFRWRILWAWSGTAIVLPALASIPPLSYLAMSGSPLYVPFSLGLVGVTLALFISFLPGVVTVVRFVLRVHNTFAQYEIDRAALATNWNEPGTSEKGE